MNQKLFGRFLISVGVLGGATDKLQVLQIVERLQRKLHENGDTSQTEKLTVLYNTLKSPLFNQILTLQQSIKQLKEQVSYKFCLFC